MNLQTLASHTIDVDLVPDIPQVLDVGCRWFDFTRQIIDRWPAARITALDPSFDVLHLMSLFPQERAIKHLHWYELALVGDRRNTARFGIGIAGDGAGNLVLEPGQTAAGDRRIVEVQCCDILELSARTLVEHWDIVKLDCEGSEFGILENWPGPIATQISVEFHDCEKPRYRSETYYDWLWQRLPWYRAVKHELSKNGAGWGHWDTLLVLKNLSSSGYGYRR